MSAPLVSGASRGLAGRRRSIILFSLVLFFYWLAQYIYVPTFSVYAQRRGASLDVVGLAVGAYGLSQLLLRLPLGLASDRWGRRKPFIVAGLILTGGSCLILAWAPTPAWLFWGRALAGVAGSGWVASTVLYASYFEPEQALWASGLVTFVAVAGQTVAMGIGGSLADLGGWLAPFYVGVLASLTGLVFMIGVADERVIQQHPLNWRTLGHTAARPAILATSAIAAVGQYLSQATTYGFVPLYAADTLGASATALGALATLTLVPYTLASLGSAAVARRMTPRRALILGLIVAGLGTAAVPMSPSLAVLAGVRVAFGLGSGLIYPIAMGLSIAAVPAEERALAMGIFQALYAVGMFAGPTASGFLARAIGIAPMFLLTGLLPLAAAWAAARWRMAASWKRA